MTSRILPRVFAPARLNLRMIEIAGQRRKLETRSYQHLYFAFAPKSSRIKSNWSDIGQLSLFRPLQRLDAIFQLRFARRAGAVDAAKNLSVRFDAMTHDAAVAVRANRRQRVDRALEAVEGVMLPANNDFECLVVFVLANFTCSHTQMFRAP